MKGCSMRMEKKILSQFEIHLDTAAGFIERAKEAAQAAVDFAEEHDDAERACTALEIKERLDHVTRF